MVLKFNRKERYEEAVKRLRKYVVSKCLIMDIADEETGERYIRGYEITILSNKQQSGLARLSYPNSRSF